jgi:hypothetical protein
VLALIEPLLVPCNYMVAPDKNPSVAIGTTKPCLQPSFFFQSTILSCFFSISVVQSIKIILKSIYDWQSWINGINNLRNGGKLVRNGINRPQNGIDPLEIGGNLIRNGIDRPQNGIDLLRIGSNLIRNGINRVWNGINLVNSGLYVLSRKSQGIRYKS